MKRWLSAAVMLFVGVACSETHSSSEEKIEGVVRVFMHERHSWSVMTLGGRDHTLKLEGFRVSKTDADAVPVTFVLDVPQGEPMWVILRGERTKCWGCYSFEYKSAEFHIHSVRDVQGADWDHGKQGHGQTTIVE